jgi:phospholipase D1/2
VHIIGWDIHSETALVGSSGRVFFTALLELKPALQVNILIWDFAALYAAEREWNSAGKFTVAGRGGFTSVWIPAFRWDLRSQKIVVIDNAVAFSGGLDLTIRRWDTSEHLAVHPQRRNPHDRPYPPFHDVQCMVDGDAAVAGTLGARRGRSLPRVGASRGEADTGWDSEDRGEDHCQQRG